ncbi:MAG TPA: AAA domain-containing protein, partial [Verrucomicrobiae bacterium]|nr:AAA domain-containing protein [Verrucomicrobiae bacterium]
MKDLPAHPCVELIRDIAKPEEPGEDHDHDVILRVTRPKITPCPPPPAALAEWLKPGWQEPAGAVEIEPARESAGANGVPERFETDPSRASLLRAWLKQREQWMTNERPAREALALFQSVYEWHGIKEREGERIEMAIGDGLLDCPQKNGEKFRHPILLQKLELEFYPEKQEPQFVLRRREQQPELYLEFLRVLPKVNTQQLARCADELKKAEFAPLGGEETDGFLRRLIQGLFPSSGRFIENGQTAPSAQPNQPSAIDDLSLPSIRRQPVIFMRQRRTGPGNVFDLVLEDIGNRGTFSSSLLQILGLGACGSAPAQASSIAETFGNEDEEVLLSKPANREQLEIARQLARRDCVLVQGPPGTGKTHTIANILGHLLSQGKRVLVTAHTPKALRVLRPKIVEALQPLCISVLQNDKHSQEELQASVRKMHVRLSEDERLLEREAERTRVERKRILDALTQAREKLLAAREDEIRDVVFGEKSLRPIAAATRVKEGVGRDDWIPAPVNAGASMPLSLAEVSELYQTNARVSADDERELAGHRPDLSTLASPKQFKNAIEEIGTLAQTELRLREELWDSAREPEDLTEFDRLLELASAAMESLRDSAPWQLEAVQAGCDGAEARQVWESLAGMIENSWREIHECNALIMEHGPEISDSRTPRELLPLVEAMIQHKEAGHSFGRLTKLTHRNWFDFAGNVRIGQRALDLDDAGQLRAVRALLRLRHLRAELVERWSRQMAPQGGLTCSDLSERPEQVCRQFVPQIQHCLEWQTATWQPLEEQMQRLGFNWPAFLESTAPEPG